MKIKILIPVYNDWQSVFKLLENIDKEIAALKLKAMQMNFDKLTPAQEKYFNSWDIGT